MITLRLKPSEETLASKKIFGVVKRSSFNLITNINFFFDYRWTTQNKIKILMSAKDIELVQEKAPRPKVRAPCDDVTKLAKSKRTQRGRKKSRYIF